MTEQQSNARFALAVLFVVCLPADAQEWIDAREQLDQHFAEQLDALADRCDELGLTTEAQITRTWFIHRTPNRIYLFLPQPKAPDVVGEEGSPTRFWFKLRSLSEAADRHIDDVLAKLLCSSNELRCHRRQQLTHAR